MPEALRASLWQSRTNADQASARRKPAVARPFDAIASPRQSHSAAAQLRASVPDSATRRVQSNRQAPDLRSRVFCTRARLRGSRARVGRRQVRVVSMRDCLRRSRDCLSITRARSAAMVVPLRIRDARPKKRRGGLRRSRRCLHRIDGCLSCRGRACRRMQVQAARTHPQGFFMGPQAARQGPQGLFMGSQASRQGPQVFSIARCLPVQASASLAARSASVSDRSMPAAARSASVLPRSASLSDSP